MDAGGNSLLLVVVGGGTASHRNHLFENHRFTTVQTWTGQSKDGPNYSQWLVLFNNLAHLDPVV